MMKMIIKDKKGGSKKSGVFSLYSQKRAQDKVLSVYWIAILILTAGGIYGMVYSFYTHPYDIREVESEILVDRIADCISYGGEINSEVFSENGFREDFYKNFLEICHLDLSVGTESEITEFYLDINFYDSENAGEEVYSISEGNVGLIAGCNIQEEKDFRKEVKCTEGEFFSFSNEGQLYLIKIFSVVRKTNQNAK